MVMAIINIFFCNAGGFSTSAAQLLGIQSPLCNPSQWAMPQPGRPGDVWFEEEEAQFTVIGRGLAPLGTEHPCQGKFVRCWGLSKLGRSFGAFCTQQGVPKTYVGCLPGL